MVHFLANAKFLYTLSVPVDLKTNPLEGHISTIQVTNPSIHPFSLAYLGSGHSGSRFSRVVQMSFTPSIAFQFLLGDPCGIPRLDGLYSPPSGFWVSSQLDVPITPAKEDAHVAF